MNAPQVQRRSQLVALVVGTLALIVCLLLGLGAPREALLSYLFAFLFFTGLSVGSLALAMVHSLTGGAWGFYIRPQLLAAARTLPLQAVLVLPILIGLHVLYPWADSDRLAHDALLRAQGWYLDPTFFVIRTIVYFALWLGLLSAFARRIADPQRLSRIAAPGLIVYALTATLAAVDWVMSLLPHWHSTAFGMMVATGWMLAAAALATLWAMRAATSIDAHPAHLLRDLGNLLLMFVLAWSYLAFMQYLTVWIADLPAETSWYIPRTLTSWRVLAWFLIAFHFAVPFTLLLSRHAKERREWLAAVCSLLLIASLADALWLVVPTFRAQGFALRWTDLAAPLGIGALWMWVFLGRLRSDRLPDRAAPRPPQLLEHANG